MKIRAALLALAMTFGITVAAVEVTTEVASAAVYAVSGVTVPGPHCNYQMSTSSNIIANRLRSTVSYSSCDLLLSDYLISPNACVWTFDVETAQASGRYCTGYEQNRTYDSMTVNIPCVRGHRYYLDLGIYAYRHVDGSPVPLTIASRAIRVVCGGSTW